MPNRTRRIWLVISLLTTLLAVAGPQRPSDVQAQTPTQPPTQTQTGCRNFAVTGKQVCGIFLQYWTEHGALTQQGLPLTGEFTESSPTNGKTYRVQYFERAVFELHPENKPPYNVLLSLLGNAYYSRNYRANAPGQQANTEKGSILFPETGMRVGGRFLEYWRANGGLTQQGYPISNEFNEKSALNGATYRVQYFERAVLELHPENKPPFDVLLSQLGTYYVKIRYPNGEPDDWAILHKRPLQLNQIKSISPCPVSEASVKTPQFGAAAGTGPIFAVLGADTNGTVFYGGARQEGGWYYQKVLWIGKPSFQGPVLVRGRQLDGPKELGFGTGAIPEKELTLDADNGGVAWSEWPSEVRFQGRGCYAFQVDTLDLTDVIVFRAVENP